MRIIGIALGGLTLSSTTFGKTRIRAIEAEASLGKLDIRDYYEIEVQAPTDGSEEATALVRKAALDSLRARLPAKIDKIVVGLDSGLSTFRNLKLPTRDRKAIRAAVQFELEDELPFDAEISQNDFAIISSDKKSSEVHIEATLKDHLSRLIETLKAAGFDPDVVTSDTWAYRSLMNQIEPVSEQGLPALLVHFGTYNSCLYVHSLGKPQVCRHPSWGGQKVVEAIAAKYGLTQEQAEKTLHDQGFVLTAAQRATATQEQKDFSRVIEDSLRELFQEIRQVQLTSRKATTHLPTRIYLTGGLSLTPGVSEFFESEFRLPTVRLSPLRVVSAAGIQFNDKTEAKFALAMGLTLAGSGLDRTRPINWRKNDFAKGGSTGDFDIKKHKKAVGIGSALLGCLLLSMGVQSSVYRGRVTTLDERLERSMKSFFGFLTKNQVRTYLSETDKLRKAIDKELKHQREVAKLYSENRLSPLNGLKGLSARIGRNVVVDMTQFQLGSGQEAPISLTFLVSNPQMAEQLSQQIAPYLRDLKKSEPLEVPSPEGVGTKLKITFSGKAKERLYE